jgi:hypothetical protein
LRKNGSKNNNTKSEKKLRNRQRKKKRRKSMEKILPLTQWMTCSRRMSKGISLLSERLEKSGAQELQNNKTKMRRRL